MKIGKITYVITRIVDLDNPEHVEQAEAEIIHVLQNEAFDTTVTELFEHQEYRDLTEDDIDIEINDPMGLKEGLI